MRDQVLAGRSRIGAAHASRPWRGRALLLLCAWLTNAAHAELQFDVFLGYDGIIKQNNWFPVLCEVFNDGPGFEAVFELNNVQYGAGFSRRVALELPTNTRKRFVVPVFASGQFSTMWNARLLDARGKVRAESTNLRPKKSLHPSSLAIAGLPRTFGGLPALPVTKLVRQDLQPAVGHLRPEVFPDHPIALEGLDVLYLNSQKALDLKAPQYNALLAWVHAGGHLIVAVEQPTDVNGTPWLGNLLPCEFTQVVNAQMHGEPSQWLTNTSLQTSAPTNSLTGTESRIPAIAHLPPQLQARYGLTRLPATGSAPTASATSAPDSLNPFPTLPSDPAFDQAKVPVSTGPQRDGQVVLSADYLPLVIQANRGRGKVTVLAFSPEREPFRSWRNLPWFWVKTMELPTDCFTLTGNSYNTYYQSLDGVFGAMIDSKQVRKLPVIWLLALLMVYLAVIGPVDQIVLKRLNRQMLTWITFPIYVAFFSVLIYFIGYKLRAGETEWNELHIVDLLPHGERLEWRGRTFACLYSPANARYPLASEQQFAAFRGESRGNAGGNQEGTRAEVELHGNSYQAEVFVPVWTSQLLIHDWWQPGNRPFRATLTTNASGLTLTLKNEQNRKLEQARLFLHDRLYELGEVPPGQTRTFALNSLPAQTLAQFVTTHSAEFGAALQQRNQAFGGDALARQWNAPKIVAAASFASSGFPTAQPSGGFFPSGFLGPAGLDLKPLLDRGDAVVLAWESGASPIPSIRRFAPRRLQEDTLWRLQIPAAPSPAL